MADDTYTAEDLAVLGMAELRDIGKSLELTFGPSVSKAQAREDILAAQPKQTLTVEIVHPDVADAPADPVDDAAGLPLVRRDSTGEWKCPFTGCETRDSHESKQVKCACGAAVIDGDQIVKTPC